MTWRLGNYFLWVYKERLIVFHREGDMEVLGNY